MAQIQAPEAAVVDKNPKIFANTQIRHTYKDNANLQILHTYKDKSIWKQRVLCTLDNILSITQSNFIFIWSREIALTKVTIKHALFSALPRDDKSNQSQTKVGPNKRLLRAGQLMPLIFI